MDAIEIAWSEGFHGLAVAVAIMYDTSLRPGDVRALTCSQVDADRITLVVSKTGRPDAKPIWPETIAIVEKYKAELGIEWMPSAVLIRTRRGRPYTKDRLARDARMIFREAGIPDAVQLRDIRRTASKERAEAGATEAELAASTGHSIERGGQILDTYNPRSFEMAKAAQVKRGNKMRAKV